MPAPLKLHPIRMDEEVWRRLKLLQGTYATTLNQTMRYALKLDDPPGAVVTPPKAQAVKIVTEAMEPRRIPGNSNEALAQALADPPPERPKVAQPLKLQPRPKPTPAPASDPIENWRDRRAAKGALPRPGEKPPPGKK